MPDPTQAVPAAAQPKSPMSDSERDLLARLILGEGGDSVDDMRQVGSVVLNRARMGNQSIAQVIAAPHQFEAYDNPTAWNRQLGTPQDSPRFQQALGVVDGLINNGPAGPYDHFYAPRAQAALHRPKPAFDNGTGVDYGAQRFFSLGYAGHPALPAAGYAAQQPQASQPQTPQPQASPPQTPQSPPAGAPTGGFWARDAKGQAHYIAIDPGAPGVPVPWN
ncbi:cell wall hydrolase [Caulobacter sp. KR2-114]|uniref:cell wall hydrolase n=1 Tax=Caulobacter sp. KR2-114 TaxID=3400912 RepID=UPI003C03DB84